MVATRGKGYADRGRQRRKGKCKANEGKRARADKGMRARTRVN